MIVRGLLFDLDGTLIDSKESICDAASQAFARFDCQVSPKDIEAHLGAPLEELWALFGRPQTHDYEAFKNAYIEEHDAHPARFPKALPRVREALELFSAVVPCAVATTKPSLRAREQLDAISLTPYFKHVQGTDLPMKHKPEPDVVLAASRALDVDAEHCFMVGDTHRDVGAARAANMGAAFIGYSAQARERAKAYEADFIVEDLVELYEKLKARLR